MSEEIYKALSFLLENYTGRLLIDADGLNTLAAFGKEKLKDKKCEVVLTPHIGEFARLTGKNKEEILLDPITCAKDFAKEFGVTVLLKNAVSVITDGSETVINVTGDAGMAKGGSGDVLSGFAAGLLNREEEPFFCVSIAAYLFGRAGEIAAKEQNSYTITPSDIITAIPKAINSVL